MSLSESSLAQGADADTVLSVDGVSKKFCRKLKTSLAYGVQDIARELFGIQRRGQELREGEFWALDNVGFKLAKGASVGLVGANGAGKTTLLKVLSGLLKPDQGRVRIRGRMAPLIALGAGFKPVLSGRENIYVNLSILGMSVREIDERFKEIVDFSELGDGIDAPLQTYSSGMAARLGFSCAIHTDPEILLIDEVLAVGDIRFRAKCYRRLAELRRRGTAFLLVSHSPTAILGSCDQCIYLEGGRIVKMGDTPEVIRRYEEDLRNIRVSKPGQAGTKAASKAVAVEGFKVEDLYFADASGRKIEAPVCGDPTSFRIRCNSAEAFPAVTATIIIREAFGDLQTILTLSTGKTPVELKAGCTEIELNFPYLGLQSGLYSMKVGLTANALEHIAAIESFRFYVGRNDRTQHCAFYQPCEWRTIPEPPRAGELHEQNQEERATC